MSHLIMEPLVRRNRPTTPMQQWPGPPLAYLFTVYYERAPALLGLAIAIAGPGATAGE